MNTCPNGHDSKDAEWCDTCGAPLQGGTGAAATAVASPDPASSVPAGPGPVTICPSCGDSNPESNLFCESCGLDFVTGQLPPPVAAPDPTLVGLVDPTGPLVAATPVDLGTDLGWTATLTIDAEWFAAKGEGIGTPPDRAPRTVDLRHGTVLIGRTRSSGANPGITIDDDHGISRKHAELIHDASANTWSITDVGSTNGTFVVAAGAPLAADLAPIAPNVPLALAETDQVFVGAWTRLDLTASSNSAAATSAATSDPAP
jgi:FHA domain/Double zinc ribbon